MYEKLHFFNFHISKIKAKFSLSNSKMIEFFTVVPNCLQGLTKQVISLTSSVRISWRFKHTHVAFALEDEQVLL